MSQGGVLGKGRAGQACQRVRISPRLAGLEIAREQLHEPTSGDQRLAGVSELDQAAGKCQLGGAIRGVQAQRPSGGVNGLPRFPGCQLFRRRGANPSRLSRIAFGQAAIFRRGVSVRAARRQDLGQEFAVADLVRIEANRRRGIGLGLGETAERKERPRPRFMRSIVPRPIGNDLARGLDDGLEIGSFGGRDGVIHARSPSRNAVAT